MRNLKGINNTTIKIRGTDYHGQVSGKRDRITIEIDPSKVPKRLDLTYEDDSPLNRGRYTSHSVYRLDGDRLTVWDASLELPSEPNDAVDSPQRFQVFEKVKP